MSAPAPAPAWEEWSPGNATHVKGSYEPRVWDPEERRYEPQQVRATCTICGETYAVTCDSGRVRERIATFAIGHLHRDPFAG